MKIDKSREIATIRPDPDRSATKFVASGLQNRKAAKQNYRIVVLVK
jgi:hypothetical protein